MVHLEYLKVKNDLARLNILLKRTREKYQKALNRAAIIPFLIRFSDFVIPFLSFGLVTPKNRKMEIEKKKTEIHRRFSPLIENIETELIQISSDYQIVDKLDHQFTVAMGPSQNFNGYPGDWAEISRSIRDRDNNRCTECGRNDLILHAHHVIPLSSGGSNNMSNIITLCELCHRKKHPHMIR